MLFWTNNFREVVKKKRQFEEFLENQKPIIKRSYNAKHLSTNIYMEHPVSITYSPSFPLPLPHKLPLCASLLILVAKYKNIKH